MSAGLLALSHYQRVDDLLADQKLGPVHGPNLWEVCEACNYDTHICPGCGTWLTHAQAQRGGHCP